MINWSIDNIINSSTLVIKNRKNTFKFSNRSNYHYFYYHIKTKKFSTSIGAFNENNSIEWCNPNQNLHIKIKHKLCLYKLLNKIVNQ